MDTSSRLTDRIVEQGTRVQSRLTEDTSPHYSDRYTNMLFRLSRQTWAHDGDPGDETDHLDLVEPTDDEIAAFLGGLFAPPETDGGTSRVRA